MNKQELTVEKEPLYEVIIGDLYLIKKFNNRNDFYFDTSRSLCAWEKSAYQLTEAEIKSIDERYWPFAVPVKASVEDYEVEEEPKRWVVRQGGSEVWYLQGFRNSLDGDIVKQWCNHEGCIKFTDKSKAEAVATLVEGSMEEV